jgi:hypothetical protein
MTGYYEGINKYRDRRQTMNLVGAEASIGSAHKYIHIHTYIMLYYTRTYTLCVCMYVCMYILLLPIALRPFQFGLGFPYN